MRIHLTLPLAYPYVWYYKLNRYYPTSKLDMNHSSSSSSSSSFFDLDHVYGCKCFLIFVHQLSLFLNFEDSSSFVTILISSSHDYNSLAILYFVFFHNLVHNMLHITGKDLDITPKLRIRHKFISINMHF